jgi:hypothetical protein
LSRVSWVKELRAAHYVDELSLGSKDLRNALRHRPLPIRTGDEVGATIVAGGAGAKIVEIKGVEVHHLEDPVAVLLDRWNGKDDGLGAKVRAQKSVRSIGVGVTKAVSSGVKTRAKLRGELKGPLY